MVASNKNELVRRISKLAKQNRELEEKLKKFLKQNERLLRENEELKESAGTLKATVDSEKSGRSLRFNMVTVLFANMHGFSKLVEDMDSTSVMDELDEVLIEFDAIVAKYKIEKIKTIGDTFMCAGGIPDKNITNPVDVVMAAIEMRNFLNNYEIKKRGLERKIWELKIGIHTGPVTALVSGKKKVSYDIKGDTVNTASRIEAVS
ncbi:MAG TPA: adenylate/guanylate cyclase domain-containing protein, partial [Bacteroidales bacterium]|nr:adenylate/guanylate cyclase domain-containing protein [Bacteroidales bacterium]